MKLGNISLILANSPFKDKADVIAAAFDQQGVDTLEKLDNGPRYFGTNIAGYSAYQICSYVREAAIRQAMESVEEIQPVPEYIEEIVAEFDALDEEE